MMESGGPVAGTAYSVAGDGPAIVLVHGLGMNRHMWQWLVPDLACRFSVVTYDLLGHGESEAPGETLSLADLSGQLHRLADAANLDRFAIAGFSLGGMIARRYALDHPDRVFSLAVLHSAHDRSPEERDAIMMRVRQAAESGPAATVEAALRRWFTDGFHAGHQDTIDQVRDWILANDPAAYPKLYRVLAEGDEELTEAISAIACPTLVMTGEEDFGNSADMARRMADLIPDSRLVILPGLRHMALAEDPATFNEPLLRHFEETLSSSPRRT